MKYIQINSAEFKILMQELLIVYNYDQFKIYNDIFLDNKGLLNIYDLHLEYVVDRFTLIEYEEELEKSVGEIILKNYDNIIKELENQDLQILNYLRLTNKIISGYSINNDITGITIFNDDNSAYTDSFTNFFVEYQLYNH